MEDKKIIANSDNMLKVLSLAEKLSYTDINFLIKGDKGTGKESIYEKEFIVKVRRRKSHLLPIDCSSLGSNELNNPIVWHEQTKGEKVISFEKGLLEIADGTEHFSLKMLKVRVRIFSVNLVTFKRKNGLSHKR